MSLRQSIEASGIDAGDMIVAGSGLLEELELRDAHDLDIVVKDDVFVKLAQSGDYQTGKKDGDEYCRGGGIEIWRTWYGKSYDDLFDKTAIRSGVRFLSIAETIRWKSQLGREKDIADIKLLESINDR